jgi:hypothetical protein
MIAQPRAQRRQQRPPVDPARARHVHRAAARPHRREQPPYLGSVQFGDVCGQCRARVSPLGDHLPYLTELVLLGGVGGEKEQAGRVEAGLAHAFPAQFGDELAIEGAGRQREVQPRPGRPQ